MSANNNIRIIKIVRTNFADIANYVLKVMTT